MQLLSVRTNTRFQVEYGTGLLIPQIEVIILVAQPVYKRKNDGIAKDEEIKELRFDTTLKGINALIGELQATVVGLNQYDQLAGSINSIVKANADNK